MRRSSLKYLASLACFTLGSGPLWGTTDYYVRQSFEPGTVSPSCTCSNQPTNCCTVTTNSCCTLIDAMNAANSTSPSVIHITNDISVLTYKISDVQAANVTFCQETGTMTIQSDVTSGTAGYNGTIINFNGANSVCATSTSPIYYPVFQPAYISSSSPGSITLMNSVFQNASASPGFHTINIAGGSLTINGTSLDPNNASTGFLNNNWTVQVYNSHQPSLIFGASGYYTQPFVDPISYIVNGTTLTLTNSSVSSVSLSGNIGPSAGITGSDFEVYPTGGSITLSGIISTDTVGTYPGTVYFSANNTISTFNAAGTVHLTGNNTITTFTASSNAYLTGNNTITTLTTTGAVYLSGSNTITTLNDLGSVYLSNSSSLDPTTVINMGSGSASGSLIFESSFTLASGLISLNGTTPYSNSFNDSGFDISISSLITGAGIYTKQGGGVQTLTDSTNSYTGGTNITGGTLSIADLGQINSGTGGITLTTGTLVSTAATMTISNSISMATSGGLATTGTTLTISSNIANLSPAELFIGSSQVSGASGTVVLTGTNSNISSIEIGTTSSAATLSVGSVSNLGGATNGLTLLGDSTLMITAGPFDMGSIPIYVGTGSGTISLADVTTISGNISTVAGSQGAPSLTITGGAAILNGNNSAFTGDLLVVNSTLQVSTTNNLGSNSSSTLLGLSGSTLHVMAGSGINSARGLSLIGSNTVEVEGSSTTVTLNGNFSAEVGSTLVKSGAGILSMLPSTAQSNTSYSLSILSGNFIGNTYSLENTSIDVASGSTITLNQTGSGTFSGSISGAGTVSILGTGPLTFTPSSSSYSGNTLLDGNIIITHDVLGVSSSQILGNGGSIQSLSSFSMPHDITLSSSLTFSPSSGTILELDGVITGTGGLVKEGSGSLYLTNTSSYTGNTYVNQGALVVAGNIPSSAVTVAAGAILGGTGSVGDADIHGTLAAGSSQNLFGTLNVVGDLVLEENSNFGTVLSPGHSSLVSASGPVTIPASTTYLIAPTPGTYQAFSSVVLRGSSITGRFSHINIGAFHANFLSSSLIYTGTEVILDATSRSIATLASGQNAINVANALDEVIQYNRSLSYTIGPGTIIPSSPPELVPIMASLWPITTSDEMTYALNQLHPAQMKGMAIAQQNNVVMVREALSQRLRNELDSTNCFLSDNYDVQEKNCCEKNKKILTTWVRGNGESLFQNNKDNSWGPLAGYRVNTGVLAAGIDGMFSKYFYAGALAGYTHSHLHWRSGKGTGDISSGYAGLYFSALSEIFYGNLSVIGSWNHYSASRHIKYGQVNLFAKNGHGGKQMLSHLDTGLNLHCYGLTLRPFDSFDYITQTENGYQEYNAGAWDLAIKKNNAVMMRNELGLQFAKCYCYLKAKWTLSPKFSWVREVRLNDSGFTVNFAEAGPSFFINGYFPKRSLFASGMTITALMLQDTLKFDLSYNGEFKGKYASSNYGGAVRYSF